MSNWDATIDEVLKEMADQAVDRWNATIYQSAVNSNKLMGYWNLPGMEQMKPNPPPNHSELSRAEAVELLMRHWGGSWQTLLDKLERVGVVLAKRSNNDG